jgi:hypothetical protein
MNKEQTMRGILIDPFTRTITEVDTDASLNSVYTLLDIDTLTVVSWDRQHALFLDDEGLLKSNEVQAYFQVYGADQPFAGRGLIVGDNYGDNRAATLSLDDVKDVVTFLDSATVNPEAYLGWTITAF